MDLVKYVFPVLKRIEGISRIQKRAVIFVFDLCALAASISAAYFLRTGEWALWNDGIERFAIGAFLAMIPIFILAGVYNAIFRYAGMGMMRTLVRAFVPYTLILIIVYMAISVDSVPRTMAILQPLCFFLLMIGFRTVIRYLVLQVLGRNHFVGDVRRVLIYGAGRAGQQLAASMHSAPEMQLIAYIDDDKRLNGQRLDGDRVFWSGDLPELISRYNISDLLLAMPGASRKRRRAIVRELEAFNVEVKTLPQVSDILGGEVSLNDIRPLEIEDLLGREPVAPNGLLLARTVVGKNVLVTGAGGSIGSELCRQIVKLGASRIVLVEMSEYALYAIERELKELALQSERGAPEIIPVLTSVMNAERMKDVFAAFAIDTVYHAAAYKHVPLVEANPVEGVTNNVLGTYRAAECAREGGVKDFIMISTDKAVRPTNVMGASKRAAEQVIQAYAQHCKGTTRYSMVRFGNVLGSSGSVVPLFRQQIEEGGPITLTDKRITRFFMTIPEAATLVIQAAGMAKGGEVFVLDMGKPIHIEHLARTMVQLSGLTLRDAANPDGDIEIQEVGLRPGEKLYEELLIGEDPRQTKHPQIMMAHEDFTAWQIQRAMLNKLKSKCRVEEVVPLLEALVPEFDHRRDNNGSKEAS